VIRPTVLLVLDEFWPELASGAARPIVGRLTDSRRAGV
jgi:hypothetical protein